MKRISAVIGSVLEKKSLIFTASLFLLFPMIATIGQFFDTGYFKETVSVLLFFWPGTNVEVKVQSYVWFISGIIFLSFIAGIIYLIKRRSLAKIVVITIIAFIISAVIKLVITRLTGLTESPIDKINERVNEIIFSLWHNPIWEEIIFRAIPLLLLKIVERFMSKKWKIAGMLLYLIVPSLLCGLYHIPGHGLIRFFDTFFLSIVFAWMALRFSLFAPIVMHYVADAMLVLNLDKIPLVDLPATGWLYQYGNTLNSIFTLIMLIFVLLAPALLIINIIKLGRRPDPLHS